MEGNQPVSSRYLPTLLPRPRRKSERSGSDDSHRSSLTSPRSYHIPQMHRRSCNECGRRKVRCDRHHPCANCLKANAECVFPTSRRPPTRNPARKASQSHEEELLSSLRSLQRRLQSRLSPDETDKDEINGRRVRSKRAIQSENKDGKTCDECENEGPFLPAKMLHETSKQPTDFTRLIFDHDCSRYISNSFWAHMSREIEEMRDILDGSSSEHDESSVPNITREMLTSKSRVSKNAGHSFMFSPTAKQEALQSVYPTATDLLTMFDIFLDNVDPVVRIFHRPTLRTTVSNAISLLPGAVLDRYTEVVIFAICYAAITSIDDEECWRLFTKKRSILLPRYRCAVEQSLSRSHFLECRNLDVLAALVLFLVCVRRHDDSHFVSSLLGVVLRNAQSMGLHRDGTTFGLSPYETEMRRRIWWHICVLDIRASEDHGCDPSIYDHNYDTRFPLSINDEEIWPHDERTPAERPGVSEMTFCLLRFEVSIAVRKLNYPAPIGSQLPGLSITQKRAYVEKIDRLFHERYIRHCDITRPFDWVLASWARLMLAKLWLAACNPFLSESSHIPDNEAKNGHFDSAPEMQHSAPEVQHLAFEKSIEVLELSDQLETGNRASKWRWLFLTHMQWHAVVFVLANLCTHPGNGLSHRAWNVIDRARGRWPRSSKERQGILWKPISRLVDRAQNMRSSQVLGTEDTHNTTANGLPGDMSYETLGYPSDYIMSQVIPNASPGTTDGFHKATLERSDNPDCNPSYEAFDGLVDNSVTDQSELSGTQLHHDGSLEPRDVPMDHMFGQQPKHSDLGEQLNYQSVSWDEKSFEYTWRDTLKELQHVLHDDQYGLSRGPEASIKTYYDTLWSTL